jgi:hypothetical protein
MTLVDRQFSTYYTSYTFKYSSVDGLVRVEMERSGSITVVQEHRKTRLKEPVVIYVAGINFEWGTHNELVKKALLKEPTKNFYQGDFTKLQRCLENLCSDD